MKQQQVDENKSWKAREIYLTQNSTSGKNVLQNQGKINICSDWQQQREFSFRKLYYKFFRLKESSIYSGRNGEY